MGQAHVFFYYFSLQQKYSDNHYNKNIKKRRKKREKTYNHCSGFRLEILSQLEAHVGFVLQGRVCEYRIFIMIVLLKEE